MSLIEEARMKVAAACRIDGSQEPVALEVSRDVWTRMKHEVGALPYTQVTSAGDTFMGLPVEVREGADHLAVRVVETGAPIRT